MVALERERWLRPILLAASPPAPRVAEPEGGKQVQHVRLGPTVRDREAYQHVVRVSFRIFGGHVEVPALLERARVGELVLGLVLPASAILLDELGVWKLTLRVLVERLVVGVRWRGVEVV